MLARLVIFMISSIFVSFKVNQVSGLRCYVCGDELNPCSDFDLKKHEFIQECKPSDKGCFLETNSGKKTRSCNTLGFSDCQTANEVEYCFCSTDLCNDNGGKFINPTDDEDLLEGSGTRAIHTTSEEPKVIDKGSSSSTFSTEKCLYVSFVLFLAIMY